MLHGMSKPRGLKVGCYTACLVEINEYLAIFHWAKISDRICVTDLNDIILNSMPNSWSKKSYLQGFDCESINFKAAVNMFKRMEIAESIYEF